MNEDSINQWVAKAQDKAAPTVASGVKVIRNPSRGTMIMEYAEKMLPVLQNYFRNRRDNDGLPIQSSHVRGFALNYAEYLVKAQEQDNKASA